MRGIEMERIGSKTMEPLFPRLHVKDTEKGGPKPPPRNKMAIYEELATPSRRLALGSRAMTPLNLNGNAQMGLAVSSGHGVSSETRTVPTFYGPRSIHMTPTLISSCPSDGMFSKASANSAARSVSYVTPSVSKNSSMTGGCNSFQTRNFVRLERRSSNEHQLERAVPFSVSQGEHVKTGHNKLKRESVFDLDPDDHSKMSPANDQSSSRECQGSSKRLASISAVRANNVPLHESSKKANEDSRKINTVVEENDETLHDSATEQPKVVGNSVASTLKSDTCVVPLFGNDSHCVEESQNKSLQGLDCKTSVVVSVDDVVLKMGRENFWKTRKILIYQQKVLACQIFELHRLVKVQRCLASSPHKFIEDGLRVNKGIRKVPSIEELPPPPPPSTSLSLPLQPRNKNPIVMKMPFPSFLYDSDKVHNSSTHFNAKLSAPTPHDSTDLCLSTGLVSRQDNNLKPTTGTSMNSLDKILPNCFYPQLENLLLVPVMSSEGLVYKPITRPCPPDGSHYETPGGSYILNATYGIPASQQEMMVRGIPISLSYASSNEANEHKVGLQNAVEERSSCFPCSTENISVEKVSQDVLPLFPIEPTTTTTNTTHMLELAIPTFEKSGFEKEMRAIKPIPIDGRRTNEAAMRIFRSIQEERRQTEVE